MNSTESQVPNPLEFEDQVFDFAFHPSENIIATGLITGEVFCFRYNQDENIENENLLKIRPHRKSCRGLEFNLDGSGNVSKDKSIQVIDVSTGGILVTKHNAHDGPINCVQQLNQYVLATGDDDGVIKLWDTRQGNETMEYSEHEDFISDLAFSAEHKTLVSTSGDGTLSVYDIRRPNLDGRKAVVGSQEGILNLFNWGNWGDCNDRFPGHPNSIDTIVKITEDLICTGSSDGIIRAVGILPNKFKGVIGDHGNDMPIERIRLSHDQNYLASCSHDNTIHGYY
ncbi:6764_t:CDS:10 [Ambispora gerdemannii]|uniref:WD repeat-containing protein JIP5 n=1 Tax=Ambispora gerdemannii TaxID=144530 RepID=A0A9N8V4I1_9GLOM|nr:6764_t:CDS:10 [Ambispora gerdemannii]